MIVDWAEIRRRANEFAADWRGVEEERAEAQTFWNEFFAIFGRRRRDVAGFEVRVRGTRKKRQGRIDLLWPGTLLAEHKSQGEPLDRASLQAHDYINDLVKDGREPDVPRYVIVSDFARIVLHDLEADSAALPVEIATEDLPDHVQAFGFIAGHVSYHAAEQATADRKATKLLAELHNTVKGNGYSAPDLERFLVRILFCLFAEDTRLFPKADQFTLWLKNHTAEDGSDLGGKLDTLFDTLDRPVSERQTNLAEQLAEFPHVNGKLFHDRLRPVQFDKPMRDKLLDCCDFRWADISPAIFGSLFQDVMSRKARREGGAHYTSELDILKLIRLLFLDRLRARFNRLRRENSVPKLLAFQREIAKLTFFDPACGCGNFLVIAYRELRLLETDVLREIRQRRGTSEQPALSIEQELMVSLDQFFGIEIDEWPTRIAEVAMWLMRHQSDRLLSREFGQEVDRLPLTDSATIRNGNALTIDWADVLPPERCDYVLGNPPFGGSKVSDKEKKRQRAELRRCWGDHRSPASLDYVTAWHAKATDYARARPDPQNLRCAFVATNSITQGEQAGLLWHAMFGRGFTIDFAHRTFKWSGDANVHVVIVGFGHGRHPDGADKLIVDYDRDGVATEPIVVPNISPYLADGPDRALTNRSRPLCPQPRIGIGNKPIDDGNYLFEPEEKEAFIQAEPAAAEHFRRWYGSKEFLHDIERWCLWLGEVPPQTLMAMPHSVKRVENVRRFRLDSGSKPTNKLAAAPRRFHVENMPPSRFLVIPKVSSEDRRYIPLGYLDPVVMVSDLVFVMRDCTPYHFGVLHSSMHMAWTDHVCGRLKSDYRYSAKVVYNNFPWPSEPPDAARKAVEQAVDEVLTARRRHAGASLATLYHRAAMPADLSKAHADLDRAVERCYRPQPFPDERRRFEYLFDRYEQLLVPLSKPAKKSKRRR
jgi:hypothetical protein